MGKNIALRRAAKAIRRKAVVAQKRKFELQAGSLSEQVRCAAALPIQQCLLTEGWMERGNGILILARGATSEYLSTGIFLLDTFCLGVKDAAFGRSTDEALAYRFAQMPATLGAVEPSYARKLLRDLAVWAQSIGFAPARDFAAVERLFGDVNADACEVQFQFGREGKPFYIAGPFDTPAQVHQRFTTIASKGKYLIVDPAFDVDESPVLRRKAS
jgi:hypothetical protein